LPFSCLFAHALDRIHHIALLRQKRVAQICGPLKVVRESLDHLWKACQGLNAWIPGLLRNRISERLVL